MQTTLSLSSLGSTRFVSYSQYHTSCFSLPSAQFTGSDNMSYSRNTLFNLFQFRYILLPFLPNCSMTSDAILNKGMHYIFLIWVDIFHIMLAFYVRKVSIILMYTEYLLNFSNKKILSFVKHLYNNGHLIIILYFGNFYLFNHTCFNIQECLLYNPSWPPFGTPNLLVSLNCRKKNVLMISLSECAEFHT